MLRNACSTRAASLRLPQAFPMISRLWRSMIRQYICVPSFPFPFFSFSSSILPPVRFFLVLFSVARTLLSAIGYKNKAAPLIERLPLQHVVTIFLLEVRVTIPSAPLRDTSRFRALCEWVPIRHLSRPPLQFRSAVLHRFPCSQNGYPYVLVAYQSIILPVAWYFLPCYKSIGKENEPDGSATSIWLCGRLKSCGIIAASSTSFPASFVGFSPDTHRLRFSLTIPIIQRTSLLNSIERVSS